MKCAHDYCNLLRLRAVFPLEDSPCFRAMTATSKSSPSMVLIPLHTHSLEPTHASTALTSLFMVARNCSWRDSKLQWLHPSQDLTLSRYWHLIYLHTEITINTTLGLLLLGRWWLGSIGSISTIVVVVVVLTLIIVVEATSTAATTGWGVKTMVWERSPTSNTKQT